jgi:hypothetical protein
VTIPASLAGIAGAVCVGADALVIVQAVQTAVLTSYSSPFYSPTAYVIVVLANAATCIEVLANIQTALRALGSPNRASGALGLLAPMTIAVGSGLYVAGRFRLRPSSASYP